MKPLHKILLVMYISFLIVLGILIFYLNSSGRLALVSEGNNSLLVLDQPVGDQIIIKRATIQHKTGVYIVFHKHGPLDGYSKVSSQLLLPGTYQNYSLFFDHSQPQVQELFQPGAYIYATLYRKSDRDDLDPLLGSVPLTDWVGNIVTTQFKVL